MSGHAPDKSLHRNREFHLDEIELGIREESGGLDQVSLEKSTSSVDLQALRSSERQTAIQHSSLQEMETEQLLESRIRSTPRAESLGGEIQMAPSRSRRTHSSSMETKPGRRSRPKLSEVHVSAPSSGSPPTVLDRLVTFIARLMKYAVELFLAQLSKQPEVPVTAVEVDEAEVEGKSEKKKKKHGRPCNGEPEWEEKIRFEDR